jgi:hypothetical protein
MKPTPDTPREAQRMMPLIRSIAHETRERARAIRDLEAKLEDLSSRPGELTTEIRRAESELFLHRREVERIGKELAPLGCSLDADRPQRIVCSIGGRRWSYEQQLDETGYRPSQKP